MISNIVRPLAGIGIAIVIGVGAIVFGPSVVGGGGGGPTGASLTANLWVVPSGQSGACIRQATPLVVSTSPLSTKCSSMDVACAAATAGDTIRVQNGAYPSQTLSTTCGGTSGSRITIDAQNGAANCNQQMITAVSTTSYTHADCPVSVNGNVTVSAHDLNLNNISIDAALDFPASTSASQAQVTATNVHSKTFGVTGNAITLLNGEAGGFYVCNQPVSGNTPDPQDVGHVGFAPGGTVSNITIDGYIIHDLNDISGGQPSCATTFPTTPHSDCLEIDQGTTVVVKNSQFWNCARSNIKSAATSTPYGPLSYLNNFLGHIDNAEAVASIGTAAGVAADDCTGTNVVAYNTFAATGVEEVCGTTGTFIIEGNIFMPGINVTGLVGAGASNTTEYNVFAPGSTGSPIGTNSKSCTPLYTGNNLALDGSHLSPNDTCAVGAGKPGTTTVTTDIDGETRSSPPEAGADEIVASAACCVLWTANAEQNITNEWMSFNDFGVGGGVGTVTNSNSENILTRIHRDTFHAQGTRSYKVSIVNTDRDFYNKTTRQRTEMGMSNPSKTMPDGIDRLFREGQDRWISFQVYLPTNFPMDRPSNSIAQLKQIAGSCGGCGSPAMVMDASANAWRLFRGNDITGGSGLTAQMPAIKNVWAKLTLHVKFSPDPAVGFIEWYGDNGDGAGMRTVMSRLMTWTMKRDNGSNGTPFGTGPVLPSHSRIGTYRQVYDITSDVYIDGYTVATTRAAAEASAFGP